VDMDIHWVQEISRYRWIWINIGFRRYPGIGGYGYTLGSGDIQVYVDIHGNQGISRDRWVYMGFRGYPGICG